MSIDRDAAGLSSPARYLERQGWFLQVITAGEPGPACSSSSRSTSSETMTPGCTDSSSRRERIGCSCSPASGGDEPAPPAALTKRGGGAVREPIDVDGVSDLSRLRRARRRWRVLPRQILGIATQRTRACEPVRLERVAAQPRPARTSSTNASS